MPKNFLVSFLFLCTTLLSGCTTHSSRLSNNTTTTSAPKSTSIRKSTTPERLVGEVIRVKDGDTIVVMEANQTPHDIRLQGIDAPEKRQAFSEVSRNHLSELINRQTVTVEWTKIDRYGRLVGKVSLNGQDMCLEQVKAGLAWHFKRYENEQTEEDRQLYSDAETTARTQRIGLWLDQNPIPPWIVRHPDSADDSNSNAGPEPTGQNHKAKLLSDPNEASSPGNPSEVSGPVRGNKNSMKYHWLGCPDYDKIAPHNRVFFESRAAAEKAGFRAAKNCP